MYRRLTAKDIRKAGSEVSRTPLSMGWIMGFEPTASRATILRANQLRHIHHIRFLACLEGLEPPTYCLEGSCSILLSYRHILSYNEQGESHKPALDGAGDGNRTHVFSLEG